MMFKEDETQYCPMCQEWAEKYEKLKQALEEIRERAQSSLDKADSYIILKIINEVLDDRN